MAQQQTNKKQPAAGGGRKSSSEPRVQDFKMFQGCNFELSPREFADLYFEEHDQSDLMQNFMVLQNNCAITSNNTIETRNNIETLFEAPAGDDFTGTSLLVGDELYAVTANHQLLYANLGDDHWNAVHVIDKASLGANPLFTSLAYGDDQLIALDSSRHLWTGPIGSHTVSNAKFIEKPSPLTSANVIAKGTLVISSTLTEACPYRIGLAYTYVNKFGPTEVSNQYVIYANTPVSEWHAGCYLQLTGNAPTNLDILAMELYYVVDNASSLQFATRYDFGTGQGGAYRFNWVGYLTDVSMWPMANLTAPTSNYTEGVPASRCTMIDGRFYFWGGERPDRLWIGGNPGNLFSISPGTGGGYVDVEPGSGLRIRVVTKYKTQSGNNIVTMLTDCENSRKEQRFNLVENSISLSSEQSMKSWQAEQVAGAVGCKSYDGGLVCEDGIYAVSRYGLALTTLTMDYNSQIRTNYVSDPIKPAFTSRFGYHLGNAHLLDVDGIIYLAFGAGNEEVDNVLFCYDIDKKAWWTYTLDIDEPILKLIHIDADTYREGIGIVTTNYIYLLPTMMDDDPTVEADFDFLIESGELSTTQPVQNWHHLTQIEFNFDYFIGDMDIELTCIDQFGRKIITKKHIEHWDTMYNLTEWMRVDTKVESYKLRFHGCARFRLTHFMSKVFPMSSRQGLVYGFDDRQSHNKWNDIHPYFKDYNSIRDAIFV